MTAILGFTDLLSTPGLAPQEQQEFLETIRRNGTILMELISEILDLSKIEADKLALDFVECPVARIVDDVATTLRVQADTKGLSLDVEYGSAVPEIIRIDPTRLRQILVNLVGNAIKFTQKGGVRIIIEDVPRRDGLTSVKFVVSDTGIGIPEEKLEKLFQPFVQADASVTSRFGGTGLGLTISKRLAEMLGGDIQVQSTPGKGSNFTLVVCSKPREDIMPEPATETDEDVGVATGRRLGRPLGVIRQRTTRPIVVHSGRPARPRSPLAGQAGPSTGWHVVHLWFHPNCRLCTNHPSPSDRRRGPATDRSVRRRTDRPLPAGSYGSRRPE